MNAWDGYDTTKELFYEHKKRVSGFDGVKFMFDRGASFFVEKGNESITYME